MKRTLQDYRMGEYKSNFYLTLIYVLVNLVGIVGLFALPMFCVSQGKGGLITPIRYLLDIDLNSLNGKCAISFVVLFVIIFINSYLSFGINKVGRSFFIKFNKVIEAILAFVSLVFLSFCLLECPVEVIKDTIPFYFAWSIILLVIIVLSLIICFKTKKISIYD